MKNTDSHVYLYAKNWYKCDPNSIFVDLKRIYSLRNGIDACFLSERDVISCLLNLTIQHIKGNEREILEFISDLDPMNVWRVNYSPSKEYNFHYAVAHKCLSVLGLVKVSDIPEGLDEPDENVLPLTDHAILTLKEKKDDIQNNVQDQDNSQKNN